MTFPILEQQRAHYAGVKARLASLPPPPPERQRRFIEPRQQPHRPDFVPAKPLFPIILSTPERRERDWLLIRHNRGRSSVVRNWRALVRHIAEKHGVTMKDVISDFRDREVVAARFECYWHMREVLKMSFPAIGAALGGKDHTSVLHGYRRHKAKLEAAGV
jgi:hypothetical protein